MDVLVLVANTSAPFVTQQLRALRERGVSATVLPVTEGGGVNARRTVGDYLRYLPRVRREAGNGYDLIHAHYGLTGPIALAGGVPVVLSLWGSDLYGPVGPVSKAVAPRCDEVVVMSGAMRERLGSRCHVIPDGVDLDRFEPTPQFEARETLGWAPDVHHVLFPYAADRPMKNYPRAREIVDRLQGRGVLESPAKLHTVAGVDHERMPTYYNASDALLVTSHSEGSPNSVKEALACNLPVASVDVGDVRERLTGVEPSVVSDDDDELVEGLGSVLERGERSDGRAAAKRVSLDRTTEALCTVYDRAV